MNIAVIFAGGTGQRMNSNGIPKQFLKVYGKPIIAWTIEKFQNNPNIDAIIVVMLASSIELMKKCQKKYNLAKISAIVAGGDTGQQSIFNGLQKAQELYGADNVVLIHDGVRPFVTDELLDNCIQSTQEFGSAISVAPAIETIVKLNAQKCISDIVDRSVCYHAKAPQCFKLGEIVNAHLQAQKDNNYSFIDSASLMSFYGTKLHSVLCSSENIKITTPKDFYTMKALLEAEESYQILGI